MPACARDALLLDSPHLPNGYTIAEHGFPSSIPHPEKPHQLVPPIKVLTVKSHGSILKAAAITGIGRLNVHDLPSMETGPSNPWALGFDLAGLEGELQRATEVGQGVIVVVTLGEVNTVRLRGCREECVLNHLGTGRVHAKRRRDFKPVQAVSRVAAY